MCDCEESNGKFLSYMPPHTLLFILTLFWCLFLLWYLRISNFCLRQRFGYFLFCFVFPSDQWQVI